jgi:hypothetical protein
MDIVQPPMWVSLISVGMMVFQLAWWIGVTVMLFKIWQKVKHLPG